MQCTNSKVGNGLRQERVENKSHQQQIKNIQGDLLTIDNEVDKWELTHNILYEKKNIIQFLKNKLKILAT